MTEPERERTFTWEAPMATAGAMFNRDPLTWMREMKEGRIPAPPAARLLNFEIEEIESGRVVFSMKAEEWMSNPALVLHGGLTATILDTVLTLCVMTKLPPNRYATTLDLGVKFVRPVKPDGGIVRAEGIAVHVGTTVATSEARAYDGAGRLVAHATSTLALLDAPAGP